MLGVGFGHHRQVLRRPPGGDAKSVAHDPLDAGAGENRGFGRDLLGVAAMRPAAMPGIFALAVFPNDHPVEIRRPDAA
jgi:hypothetical protein